MIFLYKSLVLTSKVNVTKGVTGNRNSADAVFGKNHTALFAPVGKAVDAKWGVKSVSVSKNWLKKRTMEYFAEHGGYENAHKANWTVFKAANAKK